MPGAGLGLRLGYVHTCTSWLLLLFLLLFLSPPRPALSTSPPLSFPHLPSLPPSLFLTQGVEVSVLLSPRNIEILGPFWGKKRFYTQRPGLNFLPR